MKLTRSDIEILAPAGTFESLMAAIHSGADAIYFGIEQLNMRARSASNFSRQDLVRIVEIAQKHALKNYLTLNTVVYNHELGIMREIIDLAKAKGVDAIIASDHAAIDYAVKTGMEVHISTQMNVSNLETLRFYSRFADVVVLARELELQQVKDICDAIDFEDIRGPSGEKVKIEIFVHGALCMAVSGKCYLSLHEHNHSANRGDCFQVCRRTYTVKDKERGNELDIDNEYIMSPKDLSTIHFLDRIIDSGVRVLKIEGRARPPEYVSTVVKCYNEAVNSIIDGSYNSDKIIHWQKRLSTVFNRGFWDGYYLGQRLGEWSGIYGSKASTIKEYTGKGSNYFDRLKVAEFLIESGELRLGDKVLITGPSTGVVETIIQELHTDKGPVETAIKGEKCSFPLDVTIRKSDKLYKIVERS
jgi:U32 family peptidase